jgi:hypothetical protein
MEDTLHRKKLRISTADEASAQQRKRESEEGEGSREMEWGGIRVARRGALGSPVHSRASQMRAKVLRKWFDAV